MVEFTQDKVKVQDLAVGMYVARLDRPWIGTPFPIQGFHIKSQDEIRALGGYCRYVYVDVIKSRVVVAGNEFKKGGGGRPARREARAYVNLKVEESSYSKSRNVRQEAPAAGRLYRDVGLAVDGVMRQIATGRPASLPAARKAAGRMVDSILRNPDASIWITRVRDKDAYTYSRCVRSSVWAITLGRHLGLRRERLENLALGVLLSEVGYTRLPTEILTKNPAGAEVDLMKRHVEYGMEILKGLPGINEDILWTVRTHHERYDGSGFPLGLSGNQIPLLGKIAGIVDFYDAMTMPRHDERALSPAEAMARLHNMRDTEFQSELVEEFIQAIGIYPAGTLIELSTGEVGIITEQNPDRRLRPRLLLILDRDKRALQKVREVDLLMYTKDAAGKPVDIQKGLPDGAYDIDLTRFRGGLLSRLLGRGPALLRY